MALPSSVEVLAVGAGPVGLACAVTLAFEGYKNILIVDGREAAAQRYSRALVVHARTLEVLETIGCADAVVAKGRPNYHFRLNSLRSGLLLQADMSWLPSKYNYALSIPQSETEDVLLARLKELGVDVVWERKVIGLKEVDGMKVVLFENGEEVKTKYVVGADGPHSVIRQFTGIPYRDPFTKTTDDHHNEGFTLADVRVSNRAPTLPDNCVSGFLSQRGPAIWIPMSDGVFRIVAQIVTDDAPKEPSLEYMQAIMDQRLPAQGTKITEVTWSSRFYVKYRIADQYFVPSLPGSPPSDGVNGGIAIVGDAAHVHSPAGGMGMNLGIRDAVFLARALIADMQAQDTSHAGLYKWSTDRRKAGERVVGVAEGMTKFATMPSGVKSWVRDTLIWVVGMLPFLKRAFVWRMSGLVERED